MVEPPRREAGRRAGASSGHNRATARAPAPGTTSRPHAAPGSQQLPAPLAGAFQGLRAVLGGYEGDVIHPEQ